MKNSRLATLLGLFLAFPPGAWATAYLWGGGAGDGNWYTPANWTPAGTPGPADDATIPFGTVYVYPSSPAISVNLLNVGNGASVATLHLGTGVVTTPTLNVRTNAVLIFETTAPLSVTDMIVEPGGLVTHTGPLALSSATVNIQATTFDLRLGAILSASGKGYGGGFAVSAGSGPGSGFGSTNGADGGGHAQYGGIGYGSGHTGGLLYDSLMDPYDHGSGGGGALAPCYGGAGGGVILIQATTATLNGLLSSDGIPGTTGCLGGGGGGAGGTINVKAGYLLGTGTMTVTGGNGANGTNFGGGGGSGGRILVRVTGENYARIRVSTISGAGGLGAGPGLAPTGPGSSILEPKIWTGDAGDGSNCNNVNNWFGYIIPRAGEHVLFGSTNPTSGCFWNDFTTVVGSVTMLSSYRGNLRVVSNMNVGGRFRVQGGTLTVSVSVPMLLGGDLEQTGGHFDMTNGSVTFTGPVQKNVSLLSGTTLCHLTAAAGASVSVNTDLSLRGNLTAQSGSTIAFPSATLLWSSGSLTGMGKLSFAPGHLTLLGGNLLQTLALPTLSDLRIMNAAGALIPGGSSMSIVGQVLVDTGTSLNGAGVRLSVYGDWRNYGIFNAPGSTLAFVGPSGDQRLEMGGDLPNLEVSKAAGALRVEVPLIVVGRVAVSSGGLDLSGILHRVGGDFFLTAGTMTVAGSTIVLDGSFLQTVSLAPGTSFHHLISSNVVGVRWVSSSAVDGDLLIQRGFFDFSTMSLVVNGDFVNSGSSGTAANGSTVTLAGFAGPQRLALRTGDVLDSLVVANSSSGVVLQSTITLRRNFTVSPGTRFDGGAGVLLGVGTGALWSTAGADYVASGPHVVRWSSAVYVAAGSTVTAQVRLSTRATLYGDLNLGGGALRMETGAVLSALSGTITLRGEADLLYLSTAAKYLYGPSSWLVYEGTGVSRGVTLSSGPFRNIRMNPERAADSFVLGPIQLTGSLVLQNGILRSSFTPTIEVQGDFVNMGGTLDFTTYTTSTLRMTGASPQRLELLSADKLYRFEIASADRVTLYGSTIDVNGDLLLSSGILNGGSAYLGLHSDWVGGLAAFEAQSGTVAFIDLAAYRRQTFTDANHPVFNGLLVYVATMSFVSTFDAATFTASRPNGLVYFAPGGIHRINDFRSNGGSPTTRLKLRCGAAGARWNLQLVSVSSVSSTDVAYSSAPTGTTVQANDGLSIDAGENTNWNFLPALVVVAPGETLTEWQGKSGPPTQQTAGSTFTVTVQAVSDAFGLVRTYSASVTMTSNDLFASGIGARTLVNGATTFDVVLRAAEPDPRTTTLSASGPQTFGIAMSTLSVRPTVFDRLQLLLVGEEALPGSPSGKTSVADVQTSGVPFPVIIRAVDRFYNRINAAPAHVVAVDSLAASSKTLPAAQPLSAGVATLGGAIVYSTGVYSMRAYDATDGAVFSNVGSTFSVFSFNFSSPTVRFAIPPGASVPTLGGKISGTAADDVAVARVDVVLRDNALGLYYDWPTGVFSSASPVLGKSILSPPNGRSVVWSLPLDETKLVDGRSYYALVLSSNPTGLLASDQSTFTYSLSRLLFGAGDGKGGAFLFPAATTACQAFVTTVTFGTGANGIGPGGMVALHIPDGWTPLSGYTPKSDPGLGYVSINSTSTAWTVPGSSEVLVNPPSIASTTLGMNWIVVRVRAGAPNGFKSGEQVNFVYNGFPPAGPGTGPNLFEVRTQGQAGGALLPVQTSPSVYITSGPPRMIAFDSYEPLALGPLQTSPTMQLRLTDLCGNLAQATVAVNAGVVAGVQDSGGFWRDFNAEFFDSGGAPMTGAYIAPGASLSQPFYYRTSTAGISGEVIRATATVLTFPAAADRYVTLLTSSATFTGVSIDSGTLVPGATSALLSVGVPGALVVARFTLADPRAPWDLVLSTDPVSFHPPLLAANGMGDSAPQAVSWNGVVCPAGELCRYAGPGTYHVRLRAAGGSTRLLDVRVPTTASVRGRLGAAGAGAFVRAEGPGAGPGAYALASSTGYFVLYGLSAGGRYNLTASTLTSVYGQGVFLSTTVVGATASVAGTDLGTLSLPSPSFIRVSVGLPLPAPYEFWGGVYAHDAGFNGQAFGTLHYASGSAVSDDGTQAVGRSASTWTVLALPAGRYDLDFSLFQVGISTTYRGVDLADGGRTDLNLLMPRRLKVSGRAVIPAPAPAGAWISVQAFREAGQAPSAYASVFIPAPAGPVQPTSATYTLYGLEPGSWTVQAVAPGFLSSAAPVYLSSADVGDAATGLGGLDLLLSSGGVVSGTITVTGDTRRFEGSDGAPGFPVHVSAYNPGTFAHANAVVRLTGGAALSSGTFLLTGLDSGSWRLSASLDGFEKDPPAPIEVSVSSSGSAASANVTLKANSSRVRLQIVLPPTGGCRPATDYRAVGIHMTGPQADLPAVADITMLDGQNGVVESFHCSSMTFLSPPLATGLYRFLGVYGPGGQRRELLFPLVNGSTEAAVLDLSAATYTVTGTLSLSAPVVFQSPGGYALTVSSPAGLIAQSSSAAYCLLSSSRPAAFSDFHVELLPYDLRAGLAPGALLRSTASCAAYAVPSAEPPPPLLAYAATVYADGSFRFDGVPAGTYLLRTPRDLDGRPENGDELADASTLVSVQGPRSVQVSIGAGAKVSGLVTLPHSVAPGRPVAVRLLDASARKVREAMLYFNGARTASFTFERLGDGRYTLAAEDTGWPKGYAARPLAVEVRGKDLTDLQVPLVLAGTIKGRLSVERWKPDGSREYVLVAAGNRDLLPQGLSVQAVAVPWLDGGFFPALAEDCGSASCTNLSIDADGLFTIPGVLPGLYDVEAAAPASASAGALRLVSDAASGLEVREGQSVDAGTLILRSALVLSGRVRDASSGLPLANIRIQGRPTVSAPGQTTYRYASPETRTIADGSYQLEGLDPTVRFYDVVAAPRGEGKPGDYVPGYGEKVSAAVDLQSTGTVDFSLLAAPFAISGRVQGAGGLPLTASLGDGTFPGAAVYVQRQGAIPLEGPLADISVRTDDQGFFSVPGLSSGVYRVVFSALGFSNLARTVNLSGSSADLGTVTLGLGATLSGSLLKNDGGAIGEDEVVGVMAATAGSEDILSGTLSRDPNTRAVTGYRIGGFRGSTPYRILLIGREGQVSAPAEARDVLFTDSTTARTLDLVLRPSRPFVSAKARRAGGDFLIDLLLSSPLRARTAADDDLSLLVGTVSASGSFVSGEILSDRRQIRMTYRPGVAESSFSMRLLGYSSEPDPDTLNVSDPGYLQAATFTFYAGVAGYNRVNIPNAVGGTLSLEEDPSRVRLPKGAFFVDASSGVQVTIQRSDANLAPAGMRASGLSAAAYPEGLRAALAAAPPDVRPLSAFYDILLPLGVRTALARPAQLTVQYSSAADVSKINLYWYNPAANAYVLQQDVTGAAPVIDAVNRTYTVNISHFSTYVLFESGVAVIGGSGYAGGDLAAFNFPNPFDLRPKDVTPIHGNVGQSAFQGVRGTMLRIAVPSDASGEGVVNIFNVAGERVRRLELGTLSGGQFYYQQWDGRNDSGRDVASGVYIAQVKVGGRSSFFKMALIK